MIISKTVEDRYLNDPMFHHVVDMLRAVIADAKLAPSAVREAAMLACILHEEWKTHNGFYINPGDLP